jgi:ABC-type transport system substrate-binding protein
LAKAKALVEKVKAKNGGQFNVTFLTTTDPENVSEGQLLQQQVEKAGMSADVSAQDQASFINQALGGNFGVFLWRNLHGGNTTNPDTDQFPWFGTDSVVNFGRIKDAGLEDLLKQGRNAKDPAEINTIYQKINKLMAKDAYILPMWYEDWTIGSAKSVKVNFPPLPDGGGKPLFVYGRIPTLGLSKS